MKPLLLEKYQRLYLGGVVLIMVPVALLYGLAPSQSLPFLFDIPAEQINIQNMFRAVMGLYLAFVCFWAYGGLTNRFTVPAIVSVIIFMLGAAGGRVVSMVFDGIPGGVLVFYTIGELSMGFMGFFILGLERD